MQLVIIQIADQNDNGPHFTKKLYTGGKLNYYNHLRVYLLACTYLPHLLHKFALRV